jgi:hypothetical protein
LAALACRMSLSPPGELRWRCQPVTAVDSVLPDLLSYRAAQWASPSERGPRGGLQSLTRALKRLAPPPAKCRRVPSRLVNLENGTEEGQKLVRERRREPCAIS